MTKAPIPTEKSKKQRDNIKKTTPKTLITQRLRTDLGRSQEKHLEKHKSRIYTLFAICYIIKLYH